MDKVVTRGRVITDNRVELATFVPHQARLPLGNGAVYWRYTVIEILRFTGGIIYLFYLILISPIYRD